MRAEERRNLIATKGELLADRRERLWCKDEWAEFPIYRVPVDALMLNPTNRRFAAERRMFEEQIGHSFDPATTEDDERSIISLLLDTAHRVEGGVVKGNATEDSRALQEDWGRRKQEHPFWIRPDGTVHNGNRRLAVIKRMRGSGLAGTEWVEAVILDPDKVDEGELFEMEQREQLTEDFKVRYTDINLLLALKDAADARGIDWQDDESIERVAGELQEVAGGDNSKGYAILQLRAIKYMDAYLEDSATPLQYQKLLRQVERFRDVGKMMAHVETDYPNDAADMLALAFSAIRAGNPHGDIRALRRMFIEDRKRFDRLVKDVQRDEAEWEAKSGDRLADPDLSAVGGEDDDAVDTPGPVVPNYPKKQVARRIKNAIDGLAAATLDVESLLEQVSSRLEQLNPNAPRVKDAFTGTTGEGARHALKKILDWVRRAEALLK